jgi:hypothetical protein
MGRLKSLTSVDTMCMCTCMTRCLKEQHIHVVIAIFVEAIYEVEHDMPRKFSKHLLDVSLQRLDTPTKLSQKRTESDEAYELRCLRHKVSRYDIERKKALAQARQLKVDFQDRDDDRDQMREKLAKAEMEIVNKTAEIRVHVAHAASEQKGVQEVERELVLAQSQLRRQAEWAMNELHLRGEKIDYLNERTKHLINERDGEMWRAECAEAGRPHAPWSQWYVERSRHARVMLISGHRQQKAPHAARTLGPSGSVWVGKLQVSKSRSHQRAGFLLFWIRSSSEIDSNISMSCSRTASYLSGRTVYF